MTAFMIFLLVVGLVFIFAGLAVLILFESIVRGLVLVADDTLLRWHGNTGTAYAVVFGSLVAGFFFVYLATDTTPFRWLVSLFNWLGTQL